MAAKKPKRGTDAQPAIFVKIRLTEGLKKVLEAAAAKEGLDLSSYARNTMIQRARAAGFDF